MLSNEDFMEESDLLKLGDEEIRAQSLKELNSLNERRKRERRSSFKFLNYMQLVSLYLKYSHHAYLLTRKLTGNLMISMTNSSSSIL